MASTEVKPVDCLGEALSEVICPEEGVIDALGFVWDVGDQLVELTGVAIPGCDVALGCGFVAVPPPRGDERRQVPVLFVERNAMVAVPTVKYRFLCPAWYGAGLVEGALSVVGFAGSM